MRSQRLQIHDWPGNVRQLRNNIERLLILATGDPGEVITAEKSPCPKWHPAGIAGSVGPERIIALPLAGRTRSVRARIPRRADSCVSAATSARTATFIGMERSALHRKLKSLGVAAMLQGGRRGGGRLMSPDRLRRTADTPLQTRSPDRRTSRTAGFQFADGVYEVWAVFARPSRWTPKATFERLERSLERASHSPCP